MPLFLIRDCSKTGCSMKNAGVELLARTLYALSLTRERVRVWVSGPLPDALKHWRRRRILIRDDLAGPSAPSPQPSPVNLTGEGPDAGMPSTALAVRVYRQSLDKEQEAE